VKEVNEGGGFARDQSNGWLRSGVVAVTVGAFIVSCFGAVPNSLFINVFCQFNYCS
jgi:hypothetical protein